MQGIGRIANHGAVHNEARVMERLVPVRNQVEVSLDGLIPVVDGLVDVDCDSAGCAPVVDLITMMHPDQVIVKGKIIMIALGDVEIEDWTALLLS